jgi:hypothetical protein
MIKEPWEVMFQRLKLYKETHQNCNVPENCDKLGRWVREQRKQYRKQKLIHEKVDALDSVGFQ